MYDQLIQKGWRWCIALLTMYGTEWPILCWCAVKKLPLTLDSYGATERHLPYGVTQFTCTPTQVKVPHFNPSQIGRYLIYVPQKDERLS